MVLMNKVDAWVYPKAAVASMCGIAGAFGKGANVEVLSTLLRAIRHRGDTEHFCQHRVGDQFALGTNRLAIVDPENGEQPVTDGNFRFAVSNGEIYNHDELRDYLANDYDFRTECDTEVLVAGWNKWGNELPARLAGMFAIALYDAQTGQWLIARDPLGIKPIYYQFNDHTLYFSSELKALTALQIEVDIEHLEPGCILTSSGQHRYKELAYFAVKQNHQINQIEIVRSALQRSVAMCLPQSKEPVAVLLSGGVDSSTISYLTRLLHDGPVEAFTAAIEGGKSDDLDAALELGRDLQLPVTVVETPVIELQQFYLEQAVRMVETFEPPLVRNATIYYYLCKAVRAAGYKFALSGEGADELFGGYDYVKQYPDSKRDNVIWSSLHQIHRTYLQMADRASMHATLEVRVPYMDSDFVDVVLQLAGDMRIRGNVDKWVLRNLYNRAIPLKNRSRAKCGMNAGAGYGSNDPSEGIYYDAVEKYYARTNMYKQHLEIVAQYCDKYCLDTTNCEEVYNFVQFLGAKYTHYLHAHSRPQLNTQLVLRSNG